MRIASPVLGPVPLIAARVTLAGLALLLFAFARRAVPSTGGRVRELVTLAALNSALPFTLIATAQLHNTASLSATLNATMPLFAAIVAARWTGAPLGGSKLAGIVLGLLGVAVLVGLGPLDVTPRLMVSSAMSLAAAACYGYSVNYTRERLPGFSPFGLALYNNVFAALWLLPLAPFTTRAEAVVTPHVAVSVLLLGLLCTAVAYNLYFYLIVHAGPAHASIVTYLSPAFGVVWGVLWLGERLTAGSITGLAIVLASVALVTSGRPKSAGALADEPAPARAAI
jgi:drug/metabolite transporter (DMT)-like permease